MDKLFGASMTNVALALAIIFGLCLAFLAVIGLRSPILIRIAARNLPRRRAQTALIIFGLMLATAIISSAFTTGDSVTYSIKKNAIATLQSLDQVVRVNEESPVWKGKQVPDDFPAELFTRIAPSLDADPDIDGVTPAVAENVPVINPRSRQFDVKGLLTGIDPQRTKGFGPLLDTNGQPVNLTKLGPNEVYLDKKGAAALQAQAGDVIGVPVGAGQPVLLTVKGIADGWYVSRNDINVVITMPLERAQALLHREERINFILVSNRGGVESGERLTPAIQERLKSLPAMKEAGLELFPIKSDIINIANQVANLFVSIFTLFGLFSIGVGILLIFLIFSMLSAERKTEMGIARAVGMQRAHLVRMFMAEGAMYGLGSAVIGALVGIGIGFALVYGVAAAFSQGAPTDDFTLSPHLSLRSLLVSFLAGSVVTFITVFFASRQTSRLNIVRAIRDIPEPVRHRATRSTLNWGVVLIVVGLLLALMGFGSENFAFFGLGVSLLPLGGAMVCRYFGIAQRWVLTGVGLYLLVFWLLPGSVLRHIAEWKQDLSVFFISGALVNTGAVLVVMNNSNFFIRGLGGILSRFRRFAPIVKSALSYPLRNTFRTSLSVGMFAVVVFSVVVISSINNSFGKLFVDEGRIAGGYQVIAQGRGDLNPVQDVSQTVTSTPDLTFVTRIDGKPAVGTLRIEGDSQARMANLEANPLRDSVVMGVDDDFIASNHFRIKLATKEYATADGFDARAVWKALQATPGYAVVNSRMVPTRNSFNFDVPQETFKLEGTGLYIENDVLEPLQVSVLDLDSAKTYTLTVIGVIDDLASQFFLPNGLYTSTHTFERDLQRNVGASMLFFQVEPNTPNAANRIEAAFFTNGLDTIDISDTIKRSQSANQSFFDLLTGFMALGLVVGIAALGVISARAVVERRHQIGVMRAIGFSRGMVQFSFLLESSLIAILGIVIGLGLGLLVAAEVVSDIGREERAISLAIPWLRVVIVAVGAYFFSLLTTVLPARSASRVAPADALRYE